MKNLLKSGAIALGCTGLVALSRANLINDGSFEQMSVTPGTFISVNSGGTLGGWNVVGNPGTNVLLIEQTYAEPSFGMSQYNTQDGQKAPDLTGSANSHSSGLRQIVSTAIGQSYSLSFWVGRATSTNSSFTGPAVVSLQIGAGAPRTDYSNTGTTPSGSVNWQQFATTFTATSNSTELTFYNGNPGTNFYSGLDNVSLQAVPEPTSVACLTLGAGFLAARRKRKA
jgi:hypothetical protein